MTWTIIARIEWLPDERVLSGVDAILIDAIPDYVQRQGFDPAGELTLLRDLGLSRENRVFGSESGGFAMAAAGVASEVIAIDPSPSMGTYLSRRAAEAGIDSVTAGNAGFRSYEHHRPPGRGPQEPPPP
ncbi:MAG TPA: hypothetical protein ENH00_11740, partial [Actinobacteria bacterium]|nr:hypothetical protein [Actinomycetota bacterium]